MAEPRPGEAGEGGEIVEAEVDLLTEKDLYKILGVRRGATADEIKKAYRRLSLKYHPDKNLGDIDAKLKFQHIAEAFSVLSDSKKRLKYDKSGDLDLEDFDMDHFMNSWVGEMMEEGGMVDEMMKEVLPWRDDAEKMEQFMEAKIKKQGKNWLCTLDGKSFSNKRLMLAHFEKTYKFECEEWGREQVNTMKASFESFMKQLTGIGDNTGEFLLPDGTKADMSKVKGVPDIRSHFQKKIDKGLEQEKVLEMYRKVSADESTFLPDAQELAKLLGVQNNVAEELRQDRARLLKRLKKKIDQLNDEEEDEAAALESMAGLAGSAGFGGGVGGLGGFGGAGGLEALLGGLDFNDPEAAAALEEMLGGGGAGLAALGGLGGLGSLTGLGGLGALGLNGSLDGFGGLGGLGGLSAVGNLGARGRGSGPGHSTGAADLAHAKTGDRVIVVLGKGSLGGGMEAIVHENDAKGRTMLVLVAGEGEAHRFPYKNLVLCPELPAGGAPSRPSRPGLGAAEPPASTPTSAPSELATVREGDRVRVLAGRNFEKFRSGMVGTVVSNNPDCRNMLVRFDEAQERGCAEEKADDKDSWPDPLQVAYRNLEPA